MNLDFGLWYFAHPLSCRYPDGRRNRVAEEANYGLSVHRTAVLLDTGICVFSPIPHSFVVDRALPQFLSEHTELPWYTIDDFIIDRTDWDGIILAPNWEGSVGCVEENERIVFKRGLLQFTYEDILTTATKRPGILERAVRTNREVRTSRKE